MRTVIIILISGLFMFLSVSAKKNFILKVEITGFSDNRGEAYVALYRENDDFPKMSGQFKGKTVVISNKTAKVEFSNLTYGKFAVAVFHDRNKNGVLDKNILGIPTESYGFSNDARETFSSPSFSSASFTVTTETSIKIRIH